MYERKIPLILTCGLTLTREILNGKWKSLMIFAISQGINRPSSLQKILPDATKRVINVQLGELCNHGILKKKIYPQLPPKVEYSLTDLGKNLLTVIKKMDRWGVKNRAALEKVIDPVRK